MTIERTMADGTVLRFPDDTPQEAMDRGARDHAMRNPPPPPPRDWGEHLLRQTGLGARTILRGATQLPTFLGDVINAGVNLPIQGVNWALRAAHTPTLSEQITGQSTAPQIPTLGRMSDVVTRGIDAVLPTPETPTERITARVGEDLTSLFSGQGLVRGAMRLGQAVVPALSRTVLGTGPTTLATAPVVPTVARRVGQGFLASPGTQAIATVGGGLGGGAAREIAPDSTALDVGGTITGLLAGTLAARGGQGVAGLLTPLTTRGRERIIGQSLLDMSHDPRTLELRLADNPREIVPGSVRTTAEVAQDPALYGVERTVRSQGPLEAAEFALRDAERAVARREALTLAPPVAASEAGDTARAQIFEARRRAQAEVSRLYDAIPADAGRFEGRALYERVMPGLLEWFGRQTGGIPAELQPIINRLSNAGTLTYGDLRAMSREMGRTAGRARVAGDGDLATAAGNIRGAIDDMMGDAAGGLTPAQLEAHGAAVAARSRVGAIFDEGAVGEAIARNEYRRPVMPAENVPGRLTAGPTSARQADAAMENSPQGMAALRGSFIRTMQDAIQAPGAVDAAGTLTDSAARFHTFVRKNGEVIRILFGQEGVDRVEAIARDFMSRQAVDTVGRAIGSNTVQNLSTSNVVSAALHGIITPQQMQTNPILRPLTVLYRWAGSEAALRELLAQAMLDPMLASTLVQRATPDAVARAAAMINHSLARRFGGAVGAGVRPALPASLPALERGDDRLTLSGRVRPD